MSAPSTTFDAQLERGLIGEGVIARWLNARGNDVLPAYQVEIQQGKGPRLFMAKGHQLVTPDMLVINGGRVQWIEAKTKSAFTWHRASGTWQTGIDKRHWRDYLRVAEETPFPVWLLFLHEPNGCAKDTPAGMVCPSGLFGDSIDFLASHIHHEHDNWGTTGMVYWSADTLTKRAEYEEVINAKAGR